MLECNKPQFADHYNQLVVKKSMVCNSKGDKRKEIIRKVKG